MLTVSPTKAYDPLKKGVIKLLLIVRLQFWRSLESVEYIFTAITPRSTLTQSGRPMNQIDLCKDYLYLIGPYKKKNIKEHRHKNCKYECTMNMLL